MNIVISGLLTHYERAGTGRLILIIPGWADTSASWRSFQAALSDQFDVVVVDLPGFGGSQMPTEAWGIEGYASFVGEFVRKLDAGEPYIVLGHSNGGAIALQALSAGNLQSQKLVLVASAGIRGQAPARNQAMKSLAKVGKLLSAPLPASLKRRLRRKLYQAAGSDMLVAEHMQDTFKKVVATDVQAQAAVVSLPTLLVYGDADRDTPLAYGQTFNRLIKGSRLEVVPGAGHFVFVEQPDVVIGYVREFLAA